MNNYELCETNNLYYNTIFQYYLLMMINILDYIIYLFKINQKYIY